MEIFKSDFLYPPNSADWNPDRGGLTLLGLIEFLWPFREVLDLTACGSGAVILIARLPLVLLVTSVAVRCKFSATASSGAGVSDPRGGGERVTRKSVSFSGSSWRNGSGVSCLETVLAEKIQLTDSSMKLMLSATLFANQLSFCSLDSVCFDF